MKAGVLPLEWILGGPDCSVLPEFQLHEYNEDFYIIRQSGCSHFEKPFLYLLFGSETVLLLDTAAGTADLATVVRYAIDRWLRRKRRSSTRLVVAHSHAHADHVAGDSQFADVPETTLVSPTLEGVKSFFGFTRWPEEIVTFDLGGRILDIIPIPGHEETSIAVYDRETAVLLTGDVLYPGRLYVEDAPEFARSIGRLVEFTRHNPVAHILGSHIENSRTPFADYPAGTVFQPDEHILELGRAHLLELHETLNAARGQLGRIVLRDFTIWPVSRDAMDASE